VAQVVGIAVTDEDGIEGGSVVSTINALGTCVTITISKFTKQSKQSLG
jgi:hypothetical protein